MCENLIRIYSDLVYIKKFGGLAQLEERMLCKHEAPGSKPGFSISMEYFHRVCSISLVAMTPVCGTGGPGSIPGWSNIHTIFINEIYFLNNMPL